jgi:uncharacterized protein (DUF305 family)
MEEYMRLKNLGLAFVAASLSLTAAANDTPKDHHMQHGSKELHESMMSGMHKMHDMKMSGDTDHDFADMMIAHHEQAIAMSKAVLKHGDDAVVQKKAREIIAASEKDIAELNKWRDQHKQAK